MGRRTVFALAAWAAVVALAGSAHVALARDVAAPPSQEAAAGESWTILVYFSADTNLEPMGMRKLELLQEVAGPNTKVLAFVDRSPLYQPLGDGVIEALPDGDVAGIPDFANAKLIEITSEGHTVLEDYDEVDNADPQSLAWFLWYGLVNYPADHTAAVLWDHGGGATYTYGDDTVLNADGSTERTYLSVTELQIAMQSALQAAGKDKFDILMSDTCLNATFEVARAMSPYADYMLASEETQWMIWGAPFDGSEIEYEDYMFDQTAFSVINEGVTDPVGVGQAVMDAYEAHLADPSIQYALPPKDVAAAFLDLSQMDKVDTAMAGFVQAMRADLPTNGPTLLQARELTLEFAQPGPDATVNANMVDLGDLLAHLPDSMDPNVLNARNAVYEAMKSVVLDQVKGPDAEGATGLSIYLPPSGAAFSPEYAEIADPSGWSAMLQEIVGASSEAPEVGGEGLTVDTNPDGWLATLELSDTASLAGASGLFGFPENDGSTSVLGVVPATIDAGGVGQVQSSWSYQYLMLNEQPVTAAFEQTPEGLSVSVPGVYIPVEGDQRPATLTASLEVVDGLLKQVTEVRLMEQDGSAAIPAVEGSQFVPVVKLADNGEPVGEEPLEAIDLADFQVALQPIKPGEDFVVTVVAFQPDGSATARSATVTRP